VAQYFTKEGLQKLKDELQELKTTQMRRIVKLIAEAAAFGDLKENAGYHDARNAKSFLLGRIEQLENAINDAVIKKNTGENTVQIGSHITIDFEGEKQEYQMVSSTEADILKNKISYQSPLGSQLINRKPGESFNYEIREKKIKVKVLEIK